MTQLAFSKSTKREVAIYLENNGSNYPPIPRNYLSLQSQAILEEYRAKLDSKETSIDNFPEDLIAEKLDNTWHDSANAIINNWIGCVYQVTNEDISKPFMDSVDLSNPLNLKK